MSTTQRTYIFESTSGVTSGTTSGATVNLGPPMFDIDYVNDTLTYLGYGENAACKILRVETMSGTTYTSYWSNGEETLDKIWDDRYSYLYFL